MTGEDVYGYAELHFYDRDNTRLPYVLPEAKSIAFTDELSADGRLTFSAPLRSAALVADPDVLEDGICKVAVVLQAGQPPEEVFACELVPSSGSNVAEVADQQVTAGGPGLRHVLSYAPVFPKGGAINTSTPDARFCGWMSTDFYDPADWTTPVYVQDVYPGWPDMSTVFITAELDAAINEVHLFRATLTLGSAQEIRFIYYGDDATWFYVDDELVSRNYPTGHSVSFDLTLAAGTHVIAAQVQNKYANVLKFACNVGTITAADRMGTVLLKTDLTHWKAHKVVGSKPNPTAAAIFLKFLDEAQADTTIPYIGNLVPDFTADVDSNGDAWPDRQERAFPVGTPLLDVVAELEETAFDLRILPDLTVQAFINQGTDLSDTVILQQGVNLLSMTWQGSPVRATRVWVRAQEGWVQQTNTPGVTAWGTRYTTVTSGTSVSIAQGTHLADETLPAMARPRYIYNAEVRVTPGCVPFLSFTTGDTVLAPDRTMAMVPMRVLSITPSSPADVPGPVTFTLELEIP